MCCPLVFEFSVGIGGFVIGLGQISFFISLRLSKLSDKMLNYSSLFMHMGCFKRLYICRQETNGRLYFKRYDL